MPVLRDLADEITRATGIPELEVRPFSKSSANETMLLRGSGRAFFARIFTDADATMGDPNLRYDREKEILSQSWPVQMP